MNPKLKLLTGVALLAGGLALQAGPAFGAVWCVAPATVCNLNACGANTRPTIQEAVRDAAADDTVCVGAGTYPEQVVITKPLTLQGSGAALTAIKPSSVTANTTSLATGAAMAAILLVDGEPVGGAAGLAVTVTDLTIDGDPAGSAFACDPGFVGLFYRASSGSIERTKVTNIKHPASLGCQTALGILVQSDTGGAALTANVALFDNAVDNYGANGITANEAGTFVALKNNTVKGLGNAPGVAAQNGVQIGFGARATLSNNTIANHASTQDSVLSCGVLFFQAGGGIGRTKDIAFSGNEQNVCNAGGGPSPHAPFNQ